MADGAEFRMPEGVDFCHLDEWIIRQADGYATSMLSDEHVFNGPVDMLPKPLQLLAEVSAEQAGQKFNKTVISRLSRNRPNGSHEWQTAPEGQIGKVAIATLRGFSYMNVANNPRYVRCYNGLLLIMDANAPRRFTPPFRGDERRVVTFGYDESLAAV